MRAALCRMHFLYRVNGNAFLAVFRACAGWNRMDEIGIYRFSAPLPHIPLFSLHWQIGNRSQRKQVLLFPFRVD